MKAPIAITAALLAIAGVPVDMAEAASNGRIVFQANVGRVPQLFTVAPDGTGLRQVTRVAAEDPGAEKPAWSPDGTKIAFDKTSGEGVNLFTIAPDGSGLSELPLGIGAFNGDPAYSPDGIQIAFDQDIGPRRPKVHGIFIANADGTGARRVTTAPATAQAFDTESRWSPNGGRLAFTRVTREGRAAIFVIGTDGRGLGRLTPWKLDATSPDWSPDGSTILFNSHDTPKPHQSANLYAMRPDGSRRTALTHHHGGRGHSFSPSWSPDGTKIVFSRFTPTRSGGRIDLYTALPDGSDPQRLTNLPRSFPTNADWGTAP